MDPLYAAAYADLYENHWWWRARERFLLRKLEAEPSASGSGRRIVDIGCGDALFFDQLSKFGTVHGVEPDETLLSDGPWRSSIHAGTLDTLGSEERFDWLLMLDVLEHVEKPQRALEEARRRAAENATLFITVPAHRALWTGHDELNRHYIRYDKRSLESLLERSGWDALELEYFFHWLAPLKLLVRLKEALLPGKPRVESVPPAYLNRVAYLVCRAEQALVTPLQPPFGTSLYARCRPAAH